MEEVLDEHTIYDNDGRKDLIDCDGISDSEEAFMRGYDQAYQEEEE